MLPLSANIHLEIRPCHYTFLLLVCLALSIHVLFLFLCLNTLGHLNVVFSIGRVMLLLYFWTEIYGFKLTGFWSSSYSQNIEFGMTYDGIVVFKYRTSVCIYKFYFSFGDFTESCFDTEMRPRYLGNDL